LSPSGSKKTLWSNSLFFSLRRKISKPCFDTSDAFSPRGSSLSSVILFLDLLFQPFQIFNSSFTHVKLHSDNPSSSSSSSNV
jgi:hypothetical protein